MKKIKLATLLILTCLIAGTFNAQAQKGKTQGHNIKITFDGLQDTTILLAYYLHKESRKLIKDSIDLDKKGVGYYKGDEPLDYGIYMVSSPDHRVFEILIHEDQDFEIYAKYTAPEANIPFSRSVKFKGSELNDDYYVYQRMLDTVGTRLYVIDTTLKQNKTLPEEKKKELEEERKVLQKRIGKFQEGYVEAHPGGFLTKLFLFNKQIEFPDSLVKSGDRSAMYYYYREHYFDNADLTEPGLLRTPFFEDKVYGYYDLFNAKEADTIIKYTDELIEKASANDEMFQFFVRTTLNRYDTTKRVCMEAVYVNVAFKYYATGKAFWLADTVAAEFVDRAMKMKDLVCDKVAPNIVLTEYGTNKQLQLHQVKGERTVLLFWTPDCSHCRKEVPAFFEIFKKYADQGIKVYAVCTEVQDEGLKKWRDFIEEKGLKHPNWINLSNNEHNPYFKVLYNIQTTPQFYLLDENKKIILRRIGVETLEKYFEHEYDKKESDPKGEAIKPEDEEEHP